MRLAPKEPGKVACVCYNCRYEWSVAADTQPPPGPEREADKLDIKSIGDAELSAEVKRRGLKP
jgi:hypothetical protein